MAAKKNSLVANINRKKKAGTSKPKSRSTVSKEAYADMEAGWPKAAKKKPAAKKAAKKTAKKAAKKAPTKRPAAKKAAKKTANKRPAAKK